MKEKKYIMQQTFVTSKLQKLTVTDANADYRGSITLGRNLIEAAGLKEFQYVHVNNWKTAQHWETYVLAGEDGVVTLNGPPARIFTKGDIIFVLGFTDLDPSSESAQHNAVFVNEQNEVIDVISYDINF
jgi:aspartate 1-decarboxylase